MNYNIKYSLDVSLFVLGLIEGGTCFDIFQPNRLYIYNFTGKVEAGARNEENSLRPTNWIITGLFQLQRIDSTTIAAWVCTRLLTYCTNHYTRQAASAWVIRSVVSLASQ